jgi:MFS family permease
MVVGNIYVIAATAVIGGSLFGFDIASMSAQLEMPAYKCYFNQGPKGPPFTNDTECSGPKSLNQGGITAAMPAGSWLGALISGPLSDRLGRKTSIMIGCVIWYVHYLIERKFFLLSNHSVQVDWFYDHLRLAKRGHVGRRSYHQRFGRWY